MNQRNEQDSRYYFKSFINTMYVLGIIVTLTLCIYIYRKVKECDVEVSIEKKAYIYKKHTDMNLTELNPGKRLYYESMFE